MMATMASATTYTSLPKLKAAVLARCRELYAARWGPLKGGHEEWLDHRPDFERYNLDTRVDRDAGKLLASLNAVAMRVAAFASENPDGGRWHAERLRLLASPLASAVARLDALHLEVNTPVVKPDRHEWAHHRVRGPYVPSTFDLENSELAVLSLLGRWWPSKYSTFRGRATVADVIQAEMKHWRDIRRKPPKRYK